MTRAGWIVAFTSCALAAGYLAHEATTYVIDYHARHNTTAEVCEIGPPSRCIRARAIQEARHGD